MELTIVIHCFRSMVMSSCWHGFFAKRPSFTYIIEKLTAALTVRNLLIKNKTEIRKIVSRHPFVHNKI